MFNGVIIRNLSERCGCDVTTAAGATVLANDIEARTGERLAPNTLKRLVGVLPYQNTPRPVTLNIIANYLGYQTWEMFVETINNRLSDFGVESPFVEVASLAVDAEISFRWEPDRAITLRHLGDGLCRVESVTNSKLERGDILRLSQLANGYPLVAKEVIRGETSLGSYIAAKITGIYDLK